MVYPCEEIASASTKGQILQFHLFFFFVVVFLAVALAEIRNIESFHCHYVLCTTQMDVLFLPDAQFVEMKAGSKIQSFHLSLIIFFIMISVLMNPTTEHGNGTSF